MDTLDTLYNYIVDTPPLVAPRNLLGYPTKTTSYRTSSPLAKLSDTP